MRLNYVKMQGAGNDYLYLDGIRDTLPRNWQKNIPKLCENHYGIGADGVIEIFGGENGGIGMRMYNRDGSEGKMCGNGIRCLARYVFDRGYTKEKTFEVATKTGHRPVTLHLKDGQVCAVSVEMGQAVFSDAEPPKKTVRMQGKRDCYDCFALTVGNPHLTTFVSKIDQKSTEKYMADAALFSRNFLFPDGANIEYIKVVNSTYLLMRVYERGSGATLACGTGACAAVAVACRAGLCPFNTPVTVAVLGGILTVSCSPAFEMRLTGDCQYICEGVWYESGMESPFSGN